MIRRVLPALLITGALVTGWAVASENRGASVRRQQVASVQTSGDLDAPSTWVTPPSAKAPAMTLAPRYVPLPPRRAAGL